MYTQELLLFCDHREQFFSKMAHTWIRQQPDPDIPLTLKEFLQEYAFDADSAKSWKLLVSKGTVSPPAMQLIPFVFYSNSKQYSEFPHYDLLEAVERAERMYALRKGYVIWRDIIDGFDMEWRKNREEKPSYYCKSIEFNTISVFSLLTDLILCIKDAYCKRYELLHLLSGIDLLYAHEYRLLHKTFSFLSEEAWGAMSFIPDRASASIVYNEEDDAFVDANESDPGEEDTEGVRVPHVICAIRLVCKKAIRRHRVQVMLQSCAVFLALHREVRFRPGHSGYLQAAVHFTEQM